jgi:hypothetical protein
VVEQASITEAAASKAGITNSGTSTGTATQAAASYNQVAQAGLGAAVVAGFWGMVV